MASYSNLRSLQDKFKVQTDVLDELLYADGMDKYANSEAKCKRQWIKFHNDMITMNLQSAQK